MSVAWVLNLDAEVELAGQRLRPAARRRMEAMQRRFEIPAGDVVLDLDVDRADGLEGRCWCPTPSALARLREAGARVPAAPPVEVLRRVNERGFAHDLVALPGTARCEELDVARDAVARPGRWLLFRALTFAGRGQLPVDSGRWTDAVASWVAGALRIGPVYVLPRVDVSLEVSLHGALRESTTLGRPVINEVDDSGQWVASRRGSEELGADERDALYGAAERAGEALRAAGYFGPFGVDAFRYEGGFHPLSEINARYTMAWNLGMAGGTTPPSRRGGGRVGG